MEIWKDVEGYEGLYQVSNLGNVRSLDRYTYRAYRGGKCGYHFYPGKTLKLTTEKDGYKTTTLYINGKGKIHKVHRLVASVFIDNPESKEFVNHKDGNKANNRVDNLEWVTAKENCVHAIENGLYIHPEGVNWYSSKFDADTIREIRHEYVRGSHDKNIYRLAEKYRVAPQTIHKIVTNGRYKDVVC